MAESYGFTRSGGLLTVDGIALDGIATGFDTPLYVYSAEAIEAAYRHLADMLDFARIHYAVKANSNLAVLRLIARLGAGADIVSGGEMARALKAGFAPADIIFSGVGKTDDEIAAAFKAGVGQINAESAAEVERVLAIASGINTRTRLALRINPDIGADTNAKISTGGGDTKFGIPANEAATLYRKIAASGVITPGGLAVHIGSQITRTASFIAAWKMLRDMGDSLRGEGLPVPGLDCGGGIGVDYDNKNFSQRAFIEEIGREAEDVFKGSDYEIGFEPGRALVAAAGVLLVRVLYCKSSGGKNFIITDGAMNDFIRPTLYEARHRILPVGKTAGEKITADIVGPVCETGDYLARGIEIPMPQAGDVLAVMDAGAYGAVMRSNYNSRPFAAEVMVFHGTAHPVSVHESIDDLLARDRIPPGLE